MVQLLSFVNRYKGPHAMHLEGDTRHTAEQMHDITAKEEYRGAVNIIKAYNQTWFEWLKVTFADGTGIHVTPYTKVYDFLDQLRDRYQAKHHTKLHFVALRYQTRRGVDLARIQNTRQNQP